jgi:hypothetical protein
LLCPLADHNGTYDLIYGEIIVLCGFAKPNQAPPVRKFAKHPNAT